MGKFAYGSPLNSTGLAPPTANGQVYEATGAGTAAWTQNLDDLLSVGCDILTVETTLQVTSGLISDSTGAISFDDENLSTTGTIVAANIPSPAYAKALLQSSGVGTAIWSTMVTNLTYLSVDSIIIDGTYVTSTTGTVNFWDDHILTTGNIIGVKFILGSGDDYSIEWDDYNAVHTIVDGEFQFAGGVVSIESLKLLERSSDPTEPLEGTGIIWMSDGTGKGDDGDIMIASQAGGTTNYGTLFDHSGGAAW